MRGGVSHGAVLVLAVACGGDEFSGGNANQAGTGGTAGGAGSGASGGLGGSSGGGTGASSSGGTAGAGGGGAVGGSGGGGSGGAAGSGGSAGGAPKIVFVTAEMLPGNFAKNSNQPIALAAQFCEQSAAGVPALANKTWRPWLSTGIESASAGLKASIGPWVRVDGKPVFASMADIEAKTPPASPIRLDAKGNEVDGPVWTGTNPDGSIASASHCLAWSGELSSALGRHGSSKATDQAWTYAGLQGCEQSFHLYCFEK